MRAITVATAFALATSAAEAATLTFDSLAEGVSEPWAESGFTGFGGSWDTRGAGTIHGSGGPMDDSADIYRDTPFTPISIEMVGHGGFNRDDDLQIIDPIPYDNLRFSGFRDGALVASVAVQTGADTRYFTHFFGPAFRMIDHLEIETPNVYPGPGGTFCDDCTAISYDNMTYTLAPVPLPATAVLLAGGVLGLGVLRKKRWSRPEASFSNV